MLILCNFGSEKGQKIVFKKYCVKKYKKTMLILFSVKKLKNIVVQNVLLNCF